MFQVADTEGWFNYSSFPIHAYPLGLSCSLLILGTSANCSGTDHDQERLGVSQEAEPLQGGAVHPTSAIIIDLQRGFRVSLL